MTHLIVINGASSSGRTSLVREFCKCAPGYHPVHVDEFVRQLPREIWRRRAATDEGWSEIGVLFNEHLASLVVRHPKIVADAFYKLPAGREHLFSVFGRGGVYYVQLYCELWELERREAERGDRPAGLARSQFESVYSFGGHDLRIDSTRSSAQACAETLRDSLSNRPLPRAGFTGR